MKKLIYYLMGMVTVLVMTGFTSSENTAKIPSHLRVGLESSYKGVEKLAISNESIKVGYHLDHEDAKFAIMNASKSFNFTYDSLYYAATADVFQDYLGAQARTKVNNLDLSGQKAVPALLDTGAWGIYIGPFTTEGDALAYVNSQKAVRVVKPSGRQILLKDGDDTIALFDSENNFPQIGDGAENVVSLGEKSYRGYIEIGRYNGSKITPVNVISIEEYLYSVVASEMPASWHIEALKAQTVASRSYTYTRNGIHEESGYGLCDGSHCQVYKGFENEAPETILAVDETKGLLAYHSDEVINATFFSSSGGVTESSENVWPNEMPYLRSVSDSYEQNGKVWERTFTLNEITALINANNLNIGNAVSVAVGTVSPAGRVNSLVINGSAGSKTLEKEAIRTFFSPSAGGTLESRYFTISGGNTITLSGKGWGHGVGLSQHGAHGMAEADFTYDQILLHYYSGIEIK